MSTLKPQSNAPLWQYGDWYTGRWCLGCYSWYSEEPGRDVAPPTPLLAVPNVTAHPSTASVLATGHSPPKRLRAVPNVG